MGVCMHIEGATCANCVNIFRGPMTLPPAPPLTEEQIKQWSKRMNVIKPTKPLHGLKATLTLDEAGLKSLVAEALQASGYGMVKPEHVQIRHHEGQRDDVSYSVLVELNKT
jgi:hypothetical protein